MRNFIKGMLTNRFGIVLATLNVCYFVSHSPGAIRLLFDFDKLMISLNTPAALLTLIPITVIKILFQMPYKFAFDQFGLVTFLFFVILQWLFIGWAAKTIARKIEAMKS